MALQSVKGGERKYVKYAEAQKGQVLAEGFYMGPSDGRFGIQHNIKGVDGTTTVLNSAGHLNYLLEKNIIKGDYIQVVYEGMEVLGENSKYEGKPSHQFDVKTDPTKSMASGASLSSFETSAQVTSPVEEAPAAPAAAPAAPKAKVPAEDLLAKFRK